MTKVLAFKNPFTSDTEEDAYTMSKAVATEYAKVCKRTIKESEREGYEGYTADDILNFFEEATYVIEARADVGDTLVGFLLLSAPFKAESSKVVLLCTSESVKGTGVSAELLNKAKALAKSSKSKSLRLEAVNTKVAGIYEAQGFTRTGTGLDMVFPLTGGSRLNKQTRRAHRRRRNLKHRQLRKLSTRRR